MAMFRTIIFILLLIALLSPSGAWAQEINWTKYDNTVPAASDGSSTNGKIPLGTATSGDSSNTFYPSVIKDGATYKMWYTGRDGSRWRIYYATSSNGLVWTKYDNTIPADSDGSSTNGKIPLGTAGKGDDTFILGSSVIKDDTPPIYKMWYGGRGGGIYRIYYATSSNGLEWTKYDNTIPGISDGSSTNGKIPLGNPGRGDDQYVGYPSVIKDGSSYKMWYAGYDGANWRIYYATSSNGLDWAKYDNTIPANSDGTSTNGKIPLGTAGAGDAIGALSPFVIKEGSSYKMWYNGSDGTNERIYHATSSNGLDWTKYDNSIPPVSDTTNSNSRLGLGSNTKGDDTNAAYPSVVPREDGREYKLWYSGYDGTSWRIYYATKPPPAGTIFTFH